MKVENISAVLLIDGWHEINFGSFTLDCYEYNQDGVRHSHPDGNGICAQGFSFRTIGESSTIRGPLTSILAVESR